LNTLEGINSLWDDVICVFDKSFVKGSRGHRRSGLVFEGENGHDEWIVNEMEWNGRIYNMRTEGEDVCCVDI